MKKEKLLNLLSEMTLEEKVGQDRKGTRLNSSHS